MNRTRTNSVNQNIEVINYLWETFFSSEA